MNDPLLIGPPHRHSGATVRVVMLKVCAALLPAIVSYAIFFGIGVLLQCLLSVFFALAVEALMLHLRGQPLAMYLTDGSAVVTGLLFALCISPFTPWWITLTGIVFAVAVAKHAFGGLGYNAFNPAMAGYVFVFLCFPVYMNLWPPAPGAAPVPGIQAYLSAIFGGGLPDVDAMSGATALARMKSELGLMHMVSEIRTGPLFGDLGGQGWEWVACGYLAGGLALLAMGVIQWRIPAAMLGSIAILSTVFYLYDPQVHASPLFHLFAGATMLGAFFIATDPVTASTTPRGRLVYGALVGGLAYVLRVWGAYPDGVAFAVLLGNSAAPFIDHFTRPWVLGERADGT